MKSARCKAFTNIILTLGALLIVQFLSPSLARAQDTSTSRSFSKSVVPLIEKVHIAGQTVRITFERLSGVGLSFEYNLRSDTSWRSGVLRKSSLVLKGLKSGHYRLRFRVVQKLAGKVSTTKFSALSNWRIWDKFQVYPSGPSFHPIHHAVFGPWYGSGCPSSGNCACDGASNLADEATCQLNHLKANDIPITVYLFDGSSWSAASFEQPDTCEGADCCSWELGDELIRKLSNLGVRALLHFWGGCHTSEQFKRAGGQLGSTLLGFYLDTGVTDSQLQLASETMQTLQPGAWENIGKTYIEGYPELSESTLTKFVNAAYVNDLPYDFDGLKTAISRVLRKANLIPAPFSEFTAYASGDQGSPEEEVYYRRLHFGALQPIMAQTPYGNSDPWALKYSPQLLVAYRYWSWLHYELNPYFYSYAYRMFKDKEQPVLRMGPNPFSFLVGSEIYVPVVTSSSTQMDITLPPGNWINYWDERQTMRGELKNFPIPYGKEPLFIRQGAIIPLTVERSYTGHGTAESAGALTVLVFPHGKSRFLYRPDAMHAWVKFNSVNVGNQLTLTTNRRVTFPLIYRIERWAKTPRSVAIEGTRLIVNQGGSLTQRQNEKSVNASTRSAWFYDRAAQRLIVKVIQR